MAVPAESCHKHSGLSWVKRVKKGLGAGRVAVLSAVAPSSPKIPRDLPGGSFSRPQWGVDPPGPIILTVVRGIQLLLEVVLQEEQHEGLTPSSRA